MVKYAWCDIHKGWWHWLCKFLDHVPARQFHSTMDGSQCIIHLLWRWRYAMFIEDWRAQSKSSNRPRLKRLISLIFSANMSRAIHSLFYRARTFGRLLNECWGYDHGRRRARGLAVRIKGHQSLESRPEVQQAMTHDQCLNALITMRIFNFTPCLKKCWDQKQWRLSKITNLGSIMIIFVNSW